MQYYKTAFSSITAWNIGQQAVLAACSDWLLTHTLPAGSPTGAYYLKNNISATSGFEGRVTQKLTNLTDGVYILSCQAAGYPGNSAATDGVYFIVIDKNGNETQQKMTLPGGGWKENSMQINVTGGECTIGIYAKSCRRQFIYHVL